MKALTALLLSAAVFTTAPVFAADETAGWQDNKPQSLESLKAPVRVVNLWATWCGPCRSLGPKLEAVAKKYEGKIDFYKVDVDKNAELSQIFRVQSIPMVLFIPMEGIPTQTLGDLSPEEIQQSIDLIYKAAK